MEFHMKNITYAALHMRAQTKKRTFSCKDDCTLTKHTRRWTYSALPYFYLRSSFFFLECINFWAWLFYEVATDVISNLYPTSSFRYIPFYECLALCEGAPDSVDKRGGGNFKKYYPLGGRGLSSRNIIMWGEGGPGNIILWEGITWCYQSLRHRN